MWSICAVSLRLDQLLVERGFFDSRARAQSAIRAGIVFIDDAPAAKPSQTPPRGADVTVHGDVHPYVSRGGIKLEAALRIYEVDARGAVCLDLGASTGGFSDVLLRAGAAKIYAVDVGRGQLHEKISRESKVVNLEKTHAKDLSRSLIPEPIDLIVCDVSFISLRKALPPALALAGGPAARLIALVKPQFEVGRAQIGKGGIVKPGYANALGVAHSVARWLDDQPGWKALEAHPSPIAGGDGNEEFLIGAVKTT